MYLHVYINTYIYVYSYTYIYRHIYICIVIFILICASDLFTEFFLSAAREHRLENANRTGREPYSAWPLATAYRQMQSRLCSTGRGCKSTTDVACFHSAFHLPTRGPRVGARGGISISRVGSHGSKPITRSKISEISKWQKCFSELKISNPRISCTLHGVRRSS